ncbi:unnamed protein product [Blepharisma stoltei]|uniref:Uncharacterized protein n=1 Tax=Blepharisma stoltei TaxID=1481888 RepID=A0AAU9II86_9CILI|nr:unnamed protein product [Blepharisma stoltei]
MESESDSFLRILQKRLRNLKKKAEKFEQKKKDSASSGKKLSPDVLKQQSQVENSILEVERAMASLPSVTPPTTKPVEPEKPQEIDLSPEVVNLWAVCEFLTHPDIYASLDPEEKDMAEGLERIAKEVSGTPGAKFEDILIATITHMEKYLTRSQAYLEGSKSTYFSLNEFVNNILRTFINHVRPETPVQKPELTLETGPAWNGNWEVKDEKDWGEAAEIREEPEEIVEEKVEEVQETVVEEKKEEIVEEHVEIKEEKSEEIEKSYVPEREEEKKVEEVKKKPGSDQDEFVEVKSRKKQNKAEKVEKSERGGKGDRGEKRGQRRGQRYRRKA